MNHKKAPVLLLAALLTLGLLLAGCSSETEEAIGIADRLLVMREGRISGMLTEEQDMTSENIIAFMYRSN